MRRSSEIQLLVHHIPQCCVVDYTTKKVSICKEARRTCQSHALAFLEVFFDSSRLSSVVETCVETISIQFQHARVFLECIYLNLPAVEQDIVILPELSLLTCAARRFCCLFCAMVHREREVLIHNCNLVAVIFLQLLYLGVYLLAVGAFVVSKFD